VRGLPVSRNNIWSIFVNAFGFNLTCYMSNNDRLFIRKSVHFLTGCLILLLSYLIERSTLLVLFIIGGSFSFLTFKYKKFYLLHRTKYASLGTLFYPLGVISAFLVLYSQPLYYFRIVILVLTVSDTAAYFAGKIFRYNGNFAILCDRKSMHGVIAFSATTLIIFLAGMPAETNTAFIILSLIVAVNLEAISCRGSDNLTIPLGLSLLFFISLMYSFNPLIISLIISGMASGCYLLYRWSILDRAGSLTAYLLGIYFIGILGIEWIFPVLLFFISSVLFTKLHARLLKRHKSAISRNAWQVLANILWAVLASILFLLTNSEIYIYFFIALLAAVTADTWASEIGPVLNRKSFSIADMKMHPAGVTGGISAGGTIAAIAGSIIISFFSYYVFFGEFRAGTIIILSVSGFLACFSDTFLGAFTEEKIARMNLFRNNNNFFCPNDIVNLLGSATAPVLFLLISWLAGFSYP
jgi:uncharacterized protein (TIGR00297 family)